jgi:tryptophan-rich sensory protein
MLLFAVMGVARWLLVNASANGGDARLIVLLAFLCLIYPLYTAGLSSERVGLAGSIVTAVIAIWISARLLRESRPAAALIGMVIAWLVYASIGLGRTMHAQRLL